MEKEAGEEPAAVEMHDVEINESPLDDRFRGMDEPKPKLALYRVAGIVLVAIIVVLLVICFVSVVPKSPINGRRNTGVEAEGRANTIIPADSLLIGLVGGTYAILVVLGLTYRVLSAPVGLHSPRGPRMFEISKDIATGARSFLVAEYKIMAPFVAGVAIFLVLSGAANKAGYEQGFRAMAKSAACFVVGSVTSAACGWLGMTIATAANVRTCEAARGGLNAALKVAFAGGTVMGMSVVGLGLVALSAVIIIFGDIDALAGFGFGASTIALFARVGGGIFTKAADVGADLVGKVEAGIPEDDPRNPAVIADNVGDNVGDVAGMGADLFESYVGSIIAAMTLATSMYSQTINSDGVETIYDARSNAAGVPLYLASSGVVCSVIGAMLVSTRDDVDLENAMGPLLWAIRKGIFIASGLNIVMATLILSLNGLPWMCLPFYFGLIGGVAIGSATEYFTAFEYKPVRDIAAAGNTGPATVVIAGLATGMLSVVPSVITIVLCVILSAYAGDAQLKGPGGEYALAIAAIGMLSTLGVTLATDAYGPIADNAGGIAEMAGLPEEVRERTDALDALGNTTAATGKGFAIGSAVLTAIALLRAFRTAVFVDQGGTQVVVDLLDQFVVCGVLVGIMLPYVFASLTMTAVGDCAQDVIEEVRRQWRDIPGLRDGLAPADHTKCVAIATKASLKKMVLPGVMAVVVPILVGVIVGGRMLLGVLAGSILSGFVLAVTMANAGGAWDNAKKYVEKGNFGGKGSETHKANVTGDTVGDPFKDTSGPALNILLKLMCILSLVLAPFISATSLLEKRT